MANARYYLSIFLRRLPYFIIVATVISAASIIIAVTLPPAYGSQMQLLVEAPQITETTTPTAPNASWELLRVTQQRLLTRANLLDIATRLKVLNDQDTMNPDEIVEAMLARTEVEILSGKNDPPLMKVSFEAPDAANAAGVLNEYLTLIQQNDVGARTERATVTLEFFEQEVARLNQLLAAKSAAISAFKTDNIDARMLSHFACTLHNSERRDKLLLKLPTAEQQQLEALVMRRSQRRAIARSCVTSTSVVPCSRLSSNINSMMVAPVAKSRLPVGSSASNTAGFTTKARASATRCCSPPESTLG